MTGQNAIPVSFEEITDTTYADTFAATCKVSETRRGLLLAGICPRCSDEMDFPVPTGIFLKSVTLASSRTTTTPVMCTCLSEHAGRPPDDEGCGAYWNIELSGSAS